MKGNTETLLFEINFAGTASSGDLIPKSLVETIVKVSELCGLKPRSLHPDGLIDLRQRFLKFSGVLMILLKKKFDFFKIHFFFKFKPWEGKRVYRESLHGLPIYSLLF